MEDYTTKLSTLKDELAIVVDKIKRLEIAQNGGYTAEVAKSFYIGMVGGSGRNTTGLNKKRERELHSTIEIAKKLTILYTKRDGLSKQITDIETGAYQVRENTFLKRRQMLAKWFINLKIGDDILLRPDVPLLISVKNKKSVIIQGGTKYSAAEIIGREAAKLI